MKYISFNKLKSKYLNAFSITIVIELNFDKELTAVVIINCNGRRLIVWERYEHDDDGDSDPRLTFIQHSKRIGLAERRP